MHSYIEEDDADFVLRRRFSLLPFLLFFFSTLKGRTHIREHFFIYRQSHGKQRLFLFFVIWCRGLFQRCSVNGIASRHAAPFICLVACESTERHLQPATRVMAASFRNKVHGMFRVLLVTYVLDVKRSFSGRAISYTKPVVWSTCINLFGTPIVCLNVCGTWRREGAALF